MRSLRTLAVLGTVLLWAACEQQPATEQAETTEPAVDIEAEKDAIRQVADGYERDFAAENREGLVGVFTDDAVWIDHTGEVVEGIDAIRAEIEAMLAPEGAGTFEITEDQVVVSSSGDLAWDIGTYTVTLTGPDGQPVSETYRSVVGLRKVDGQWKLAFAMDSAPLEAEGAASAETTSP